MTKLKHGAKKRIFFGLGHLLSFGLYTRREKATTELWTALDMRRQLDYHERYLRETARDSVNPKIDGDLAALRRSLDFIAKNGKQASGKTAEAVALIFSMTDDEQIRLSCLHGLGAMENQAAKNKLLAVYGNQKIEVRWRNLSAEYLHLETKEPPSATGGGEKTALKEAGN